jgi:hypothetical protein
MGELRCQNPYLARQNLDHPQNLITCIGLVFRVCTGRLMRLQKMEHVNINIMEYFVTSWLQNLRPEVPNFFAVHWMQPSLPKTHELK